MKKIILILLILNTIFCFGQNVSSDKYKSVSIVSLIANPQNYLNQKVILKGFLNFEKDDMSIYLSEIDYNNFNTQNAVYLILSMNDMDKLNIGKMNRRYVSIGGTFYISQNKNKQMGDNYIGALKDVENVELIEQRKKNK